MRAFNKPLSLLETSWGQRKLSTVGIRMASVLLFIKLPWQTSLARYAEEFDYYDYHAFLSANNMLFHACQTATMVYERARPGTHEIELHSIKLKSLAHTKQVQRKIEGEGNMSAHRILFHESRKFQTDNWNLARYGKVFNNSLTSKG
jgi:hypothetical protein